MESLEEKIKKVFPSESVYKDPQRSKFFSSLNIPSYLRDWLIKKFSDGESIDLDKVREFIRTKIPRKEDVPIIKDILINRCERVEILAKIIVDIDIKTGEALISLPELGIPDKKGQARIEKHLLQKYDDLLSLEGSWGVVTLEWRTEIPALKKKEEGRIVCVDYKPFKPYRVDLEYFREARKRFTIEEWMDVILRSMDYNPKGFEEEEKIWMISRLIPFVEMRANIIELAPKGTGKTYVYSQLSKYGWLVSGGSITRAKLFYDVQKNRIGLVSMYDFVALDEVHTISFPNEEEMKGALKGYLETGEYRVGNYKGVGEAGIVILGNIPVEHQKERQFFFESFDVDHPLRESALIDRFHGFIKGWKLPKVKEGMKASGYALNVEYFTEILHALRKEPLYRAIVDELLEYPKESYVRDIEAIKRLCTALMKLLFPHVSSKNDLNLEEFEKYCLDLALEMRGTIKAQLNMMDKEYSPYLPEVKIKEI